MTTGTWDVVRAIVDEERRAELDHVSVGRPMPEQTRLELMWSTADRRSPTGVVHHRVVHWTSLAPGTVAAIIRELPDVHAGSVLVWDTPDVPVSIPRPGRLRVLWARLRGWLP